MISVENLVSNMNFRANITIDKACKIKKYITVDEKIKFAKEYKELVEDYIEKYKGFGLFIALVLFQLKIVQVYTDIELEMTIEEYDLLQSKGIVDEIIDYIGNDCKVLKGMIGIRD